MTDDTSRPDAHDAIFCVACGYDVGNLPIDGACPECGRAIAETLGGRRLAAADPRWLSRLVLGQSLISWGLPFGSPRGGGWRAMVGFCLIPLLATVIGILSLTGGLSTTGLRIVIGSLMVAIVGGMALVWIGAILVTVPDPGESPTEAPNSARRLARWGIAATFGFIFLLVVVIPLPRPSIPWFVTYTILSLLAAVSVTVGLTALLRCLAAHASRIPDHELARGTIAGGKVLCWALPVFLMSDPLLRLLGMLVPIPGLGTLNVIQTTFGFARVAVFVVLLFMLVRLSTMMRQYRVAFREARDEASRMYAAI